MKTIIFPGYSKSNKEWVEEVAQNLKVDHEVRPVSWKHWEDEKANFNADTKAKEALFVIDKGKVNIIAKSIGISIALILMKEIPDQINKVILNGWPITGAMNRKEEIEAILKSFPAEKMVVFQNEKDPLGKYNVVVDFVHSMNSKIEVRKMPRSDHSYPYYEEFNKLLA